jgi:hypothetical protein
MAMGRLVVSTWNRLIKPSTPGTRWPNPTPIPMARKIHRVKYRSSNESLLAMLPLPRPSLFAPADMEVHLPTRKIIQSQLN